MLPAFDGDLLPFVGWIEGYADGDDSFAQETLECHAQYGPSIKSESGCHWRATVVLKDAGDELGTVEYVNLDRTYMSWEDKEAPEDADDAKACAAWIACTQSAWEHRPTGPFPRWADSEYAAVSGPTFAPRAIASNS
jgi:hypothetical protein